jgi:hypothetical protein
MNNSKRNTPICDTHLVHFAKPVIVVVKPMCICIVLFFWQWHSLIYFSARHFNCKYSFSEVQFIIFVLHKYGENYSQLNSHKLFEKAREFSSVNLALHLPL